MDIEIGAKIGSGSFGTVYKAKWHGKRLQSLTKHDYTNNITSTVLLVYVHVHVNLIHMLHKKKVFSRSFYRPFG